MDQGHLSDQDFDQLISRAMEELPKEYIGRLDNVVITYAEMPTAEQTHKMKLTGRQLLLGLYEGVPQTQRGTYSMVLPDKITLFKQPILAVSHDEMSLFETIKRTLWHEIAHHYGLDHDRIHSIERRQE